MTPEEREVERLTEENCQLAGWCVDLFCLVDRHVPIKDIPDQLDEARKYLERRP